MDDGEFREISAAGYWGALKGWGITKSHPGTNGGWICQTRDGDYTFIDDPLWMTKEERLAALACIAMRFDFDF